MSALDIAWDDRDCDYQESRAPAGCRSSSIQPNETAALLVQGAYALSGQGFGTGAHRSCSHTVKAGQTATLVQLAEVTNELAHPQLTPGP